jgi:hypothetical protein
MAASALRDEFDYYLEHQAELAAKYDGKVVAIKSGALLGVYNSELEAVTETEKTQERGTFLVQRVTRGPSGHTQTFHSRVVFQ